MAKSSPTEPTNADDVAELDVTNEDAQDETTAGGDVLDPPSDPAPSPAIVDDPSPQDGADDATAADVPAVVLPDPEGLTHPQTCPLCDGVGAIPYSVRWSPRYERCPDCGGIGEVYTGSLKATGAIMDCERCTGSGFVSIGTPGGEPPFGPAPAAEPSNPPWPGATWDATVGAWS